MEADVLSLGYRGEGVAKIDRFPVFVKGALPGERIRARVLIAKKDYAVAKLTDILVSSPHRVQPPCPYFGKCGGCDLMHLDEEGQLAFKRNVVSRALFGIAHTDAEAGECVRSAKTLGYRNKLSLPVRRGYCGAEVGLFAYNTHRIVPISDCLLQTERVRALMPKLNVVASHFLPYDETTGKGELRHFTVREYGGALSLTVVVTKDLSGRILSAAAETGIKCDELWMNINDMTNNVILGRVSRLLAGENVVRDVLIGGRKLPVTSHPNAFFQVNDDIADKLYRTVRDIAERERPSAIIDAYSGCGLMTALLSECADKTVGIEIEPSATAVANDMMKRAGITNVRNVCGDCAKILPDIAGECGEDSLIVLDPPRSGCAESVTAAVNSCHARTVIYVSCDPSTLARDISRMPEYAPVSVTPFDMFPQTRHVETLVLLCRK